MAQNMYTVTITENERNLIMQGMSALKNVMEQFKAGREIQHWIDATTCSLLSSKLAEQLPDEKETD